MKKRKILDIARKTGIIRFGKYKYKIKSAKDLPPMAVTPTFSEKEVTFNFDKKRKKSKKILRS